MEYTLWLNTIYSPACLSRVEPFWWNQSEFSDKSITCLKRDFFFFSFIICDFIIYLHLFSGWFCQWSNAGNSARAWLLIAKKINEEIQFTWKKQIIIIILFECALFGTNSFRFLHTPGQHFKQQVTLQQLIECRMELFHIMSFSPK